MNVLLGLFLIAHGLVHACFIAPTPSLNGGPEWPFNITKSWILTPMGLSMETIKMIGIVLVALTILGFLLSGLGWLGVPVLKTIWIPVTIATAVISILLLGIFWHNWLVVGPIIDLVFLYLIFFRDWKVV